MAIKDTPHRADGMPRMKEVVLSRGKLKMKGSHVNSDIISQELSLDSLQVIKIGMWHRILCMMDPIYR